MMGDWIAKLARLADDGSVTITNSQPRMHMPPGARGPRLWDVSWRVDGQAYNLCTENAGGLAHLLEAACELNS